MDNRRLPALFLIASLPALTYCAAAPRPSPPPQPPPASEQQPPPLSPQELLERFNAALDRG